jgi:hypothetical protein
LRKVLVRTCLVLKDFGTYDLRHKLFQKAFGFLKCFKIVENVRKSILAFGRALR